MAETVDKFCKWCRKVKPTYVSSPSRCTDCNREQMQTWRAVNHDHYVKYQRKYRDKNIDVARAREQRYRSADPDRRRAQEIKRVYGLSKDAWLAIFVAQGSCAHYVEANDADDRAQKALSRRLESYGGSV